VNGPSGPMRVNAVLSDVLQKHGVREQVRRMEVLELWPEIVGEGLAKVTQAKGVDGVTLLVEVRNSAWLMELSMMREDFLERVNERLRDVPFERIVFVQAETE
jgi:predicted nucleic acid-binding Zn ribbon protein